MATTHDLEIAETIRQQLGARTLAMLGAKNLCAIERGLGFKVGKGPRRVAYMRIVLAADDTYTVTCLAASLAELSSVDGVYADSLHDVIKAETGLKTRMPKMFNARTGERML